MTSVDVPAVMHCRSCEQRVVRAVRSLDGVRSVDTNLKRQWVTVEFDDEVVSESDVRATVETALDHGLTDG